MTAVRAVRALAASSAALLATAALLGCSRELAAGCGADGDYLQASTAEAIRVPGELTPPDQSQALRIPQPNAAPATIGGCLDEPPQYSEDAVPVVDEPSRRERRRERRAAEQAAEDAEESAEAADADADADAEGR